MNVLLYGEHNNEILSPHTAKALTAALAWNENVDLLLCGSQIGAVCEEAAQLKGVAKVIKADHAVLEHQRAEVIAPIISKLALSYDVIIAPSTTTTRNILPRVAAYLDVMQISDIIEVVGERTFKRPIFTGNVIATVTSRDPRLVITVRTAAFKPVNDRQQGAPISNFNDFEDSKLSQFVASESSSIDTPELASAAVVVGGGRGLGTKDNFQALILPLAAKLSAAVGASRAAVDAGFAPNDWQVGQTGKIIAPDLYVAIGISGALQHLAGIKDARTIVAINSDPEAPIMKVADIALVGDLFSLVPRLTEVL